MSRPTVLRAERESPLTTMLESNNRRRRPPPTIVPQVCVQFIHGGAGCTSLTTEPLCVSDIRMREREHAIVVIRSMKCCFYTPVYFSCLCASDILIYV